MKPSPKKGQLKKWKDDRGFGFIQPDDGGKEVFLHISAVKRASRRPQVGDTIFYEPITEPDGKIRAAKATIQGVKLRVLPTPRRRRKASKQQYLTAAIGFAIFVAIALVVQQLSPSNSPSVVTPYPDGVTYNDEPECPIKGNISYDTGTKWYHLPGMEDYESTQIDPARGERCFSTESEAISAGWQKAPR